MDSSDLKLVLACRRGDPRAWEKLVQRYQRLIYAIPMRAGLNKDQAAEIFQDVFTLLFQNLNDLREPEKLQAWLVTTARRQTGRILRKTEHPHDSLAKSDDEADFADPVPLPDEQLLILEEQHRIRTAISSLDLRCRKLLQMLFYLPQTPSYAQIANALGISEGSVGPTRARCLNKLLQVLKY